MPTPPPFTVPIVEVVEREGLVIGHMPIPSLPTIQVLLYVNE